MIIAGNIIRINRCDIDLDANLAGLRIGGIETELATDFIESALNLGKMEMPNFKMDTRVTRVDHIVFCIRCSTEHSEKQ